MSYTSHNIKEIHSGILHKVGGRVKSWHKRWVILKSDYTLQYFKEPSKGALGTISLRDSEFDIRSGERRDYNWPRHCDIDCSLVITTRGRVYYMFAESKEEAEDWTKHIQTSIENLHIKEGKGGKETLPSRYAKFGGDAIDLETPSVVPVSPNRTPKMYKKKDRRMPTKRFNPLANEDEDISSDFDSDKGGELDPMRDLDDTSPIEESSSITVDHVKHMKDPLNQEGIYDLARQPIGNTSSVHTNLTSPNSNNNNGTVVDSIPRNNMHSPELIKRVCGSDVDIHESLYDLVGRINAGDDSHVNHNVGDQITKLTEPAQDVYEPINENPQDVYEPIEEVPLPINNSQTLSKSIQLNKSVVKEPLPSTPNLTHQSSEVYETLDNPPVMYEEVDRNDCIEEAVSSDDEDTPISCLPPLPLRKEKDVSQTKEEEVNEEYIDVPKIVEDENSFYDNAPTLPPKPKGSPNPSPNRKTSYPNGGTPKSPVPTPRTLPINSLTSTEAPDKYDDTIAMTPTQEDELYDDIVSVLKTNNESKSNYHEESESFDVQDKDRNEVKTETEKDSRSVEDPVLYSKEDTTKCNNFVLTVEHRSPVKKNVRVHSATIGGDTGVEMFHRRAQEVLSRTQDSQIKQLLMRNSDTLNSSEKALLAETLREIEIEKHHASEERFKWERERLKLEEERRKFEEEKRRFHEMLKQTN